MKAWDEFEDQYLGLANAAQALRRRIEGVQSSVAGALGVGARIYPHQVGNLTRVLTDVRVRHLLADEVGLGKAVQALMVINALRLEEPTLRAAVVVPDSLVTQWRDELMSRAHEAPEFEASIRIESARYVRVLWPAILDAPSVLDPSRYALLVVDELHNLRADLRDYISRNAARFRHLLVLTATPKLQDVERHCEVLSLLEPERFELGARAALGAEFAGVRELPPRRWPRGHQVRVLDALRQGEQQVADALRDGLASERWSVLGGSPPAHAPAAAASLRFCMSRRISRARRADFRGLLPMREYRPVVVEPTRDEVDRQAHMWRYLRGLGDGEAAVDVERLARRALLSPRSLRERVSDLRRVGRDPEGALVRVLEASAEDAGDSRLDALTELLAETWRRNPQERVIVACQDSPTVDYLSLAISRRLTRIGPIRGRRTMGYGVVRGGRDEAVKDLVGTGNAPDRDLRRFQAGEAVILFAGDIAQAGLNLQCARVLVLYSVPWGPEEVEQWIGRLDRIGNTAIRADRGAHAILVYTIALRGLADERLTRALERLGVFERALDLEATERLTAAHDAIRRVAFENDWRPLERIVDDFKEEVVSSPLRPHLPYGPSFARGRYSAESGRPPAEPALVAPDDKAGWRQRELALEAWLRLLRYSGEYHIRKQEVGGDPRSKFRTIWYRWYPEQDYRRGLASRVLLPRALQDPGLSRSPEHAAAFITGRSQIEQPPRQRVTLDLGFTKADRVLQFLGHGSILHEDLVRCWEESIAGLPPVSGVVDFPPDHPVIAELGEGMYAITVAWVEALSHVLPEVPRELVSDRFVGDDLRAAHRADGRWLRDLLPARTLIYAERLSGERAVLEPAQGWLLLKPLHPDPQQQRVLPSTKRWVSLPANDQRIQVHRAKAVDHMRKHLVADWSRTRDELIKATTTRRYVIVGELEAALRVEDEAVSEAEGRVARATPATAPMFQAQLDAARAARDVLRRAGEARLGWLEETPTRALQPAISVFHTVVLTVRPEQSGAKALGTTSGIGAALGGRTP